MLNEEGEQDAADPLKGDMRAVRRLFANAVEKAPKDLPFMVFIDVNAPLDPTEPFEKEWQQQVKRWLGRLTAPTPAKPDVYNALVITNFSPHYDGDDLARRGEWLAIWSNYVRNPIGLDFIELFRIALDAYGRVPEIREDGEAV